MFKYWRDYVLVFQTIFGVISVVPVLAPMFGEESVEVVEQRIVAQREDDEVLTPDPKPDRSPSLVEVVGPGDLEPMGAEFPILGGVGQVFTLLQDFSWEMGQIGLHGDDRYGPQILEFGRPITVEQFKQRVEGLDSLLREVTEVIAVGTASCRGDEDVEARRAAERSRMLAGWLREAYPRGVQAGELNFYALNLGKYRCTDPRQDEHWQRRIVLIAVNRPSVAVDLGSNDLRAALTGLPSIPLEPDDYALFHLAPMLTSYGPAGRAEEVDRRAQAVK